MHIKLKTSSCMSNFSIFNVPDIYLTAKYSLNIVDKKLASLYRCFEKYQYFKPFFLQHIAIRLKMFKKLFLKTFHNFARCNSIPIASNYYMLFDECVIEYTYHHDIRPSTNTSYGWNQHNIDNVNNLMYFLIKWKSLFPQCLPTSCSKVQSSTLWHFNKYRSIQNSDPKIEVMQDAEKFMEQTLLLFGLHITYLTIIVLFVNRFFFR